MNDDLPPGATFQYERGTPNFLRLVAIIKHPIKDTITWAMWEDMVKQFGWPIVLAAARRSEEKWPNKVERVCIQLDRDAKDYAAAQKQTHAITKEKSSAVLVMYNGGWESVDRSFVDVFKRPDGMLATALKPGVTKVGDRWETIPTEGEA